MDPATITLITTLISLLIKYAPDVAEQGALAIKLLTQKDPLSDEDKKAIDEALSVAHETLQKLCDEKLSEEVDATD